jgi:predicted dehydrogenase
MKKIRWGILSTANIGVAKVIPAMQQGGLTEIAAISSRSLDKARSVADKLGIGTAYGSYEEMLADESIEAVYNPLPNHLHAEWTIKAMEAGKHVLCEKPLGLTVAEIEHLIEVRDRCKVKAAEAFMVKSNPQWIAAREKIRNQEVGELRMIQGMFSYFNAHPDNIRNIVEVGGGALWDIGCYPVTLSRYLFDEEPQRVAAVLEHDPVMKTDRLGSVIMDFPSGQALFGVSTQLVPYQRMNIFGTAGHLEVVIPFNAPTDRPNILLQDEGTLLADGDVTHAFPVADQYTLQGDAFSRSILEDTEVHSSFEDALKNTRVLKAIFAAADSGQWVEPG